MFSSRKFPLLAFTLVAVALAGCGGGASPAAPVLVVTGTLATATVGTPYSAAISVSGGAAPYVCSYSASLPAPLGGLSSSNSCTLAGTPVAVGTFTFMVNATDASNPHGSGSGTFTLVVAPPKLVITTGTLPTATLNAPYSAAIGISGGTPAYACSASSIPFGLTLNPSTCVISGTPNASGSSNFVLTVSDAGNPVQTTTGTINLSVSAAAASTGKRVVAGPYPVIGATVQIYTAGATGNGSAPTALGPALTTDVTGSFVVDTTKYACPASNPVVFLVASGGKAGAGAANYSGSRLLSSPGACSKLTATSYLVLNEATTVVSAYAFAQFLGAGAQLGASATNASGVSLAANTLANLIDVTGGTMPGPGFPATGTAPVTKINLLADLVDACLTGATTTPCTQLYNNATPSGGTTPTNTLDAVLNLVKNPSLNVGTLYTQASAQTAPAYSPIPTSAPADWTLFINYTGGGMNDPTAVSIDATGNVWVANYFSVLSKFTNTGTPVFAGGVTGNYLYNSYGGMVDSSNRMWVSNEQGSPGGGIGDVSVFNPDGSAVGAIGTGGMNFPIAVSFDAQGYSWVVQYGNSHLSVLNSTSPFAGAFNNGSSGFSSSQFIFPVAVAVDSNENAWVANQSSNTVTKVAKDGTGNYTNFTSYACCDGASGVAVDGSNNVWVANYYGNSIGEVTAAGTIASGSGGYTGGGVVHPQGIAIDGGGHVWNTNYRGPSLSELAGSQAAAPGTPVSPTAGWAPDASLLEAFGVAIDAEGNLWVTNFGSNILTEFVGLAVPVKTPLIGPVVVP